MHMIGAALTPPHLPLAASTVAVAAITAGAGLLGAIIGGLITSRTSIRTQRESHAAARQDERERRKSAADAAWALLKIEVGNARDAVYEIRVDRKWPIGWNRTWSAAWRDCRDPLLMSPPAEITPVAKACARIDELEKGVNTPRGDDERELTGKDEVFLWRMQQLLEPACVALDSPFEAAKRPEDPSQARLAEWQERPDERT